MKTPTFETIELTPQEMKPIDMSDPNIQLWRILGHWTNFNLNHFKTMDLILDTRKLLKNDNDNITV